VLARKFTDAEEQEIAKLYTVGRFSAPDIMRAYGLSDSKVIYSALDRQGIERRPQSWDKRFCRDEEELEIVKIYQKGVKSLQQIAGVYGCDDGTIHRILIRHDSPRREHGLATSIGKMGKPRPDMIGEGNPAWNGGTSFELYSKEFQDLREAIRERDGRVCQLCGRTEAENGESLSVHHIDHDKSNDDPMNLIALGRQCHMSIGLGEDKDFWTSSFQGYQAFRFQSGITEGASAV